MPMPEEKKENINEKEKEMTTNDIDNQQMNINIWGGKKLSRKKGEQQKNNGRFMYGYFVYGISKLKFSISIQVLWYRWRKGGKGKVIACIKPSKQSNENKDAFLFHEGAQKCIWYEKMRVKRLRNETSASLR